MTTLPFEPAIDDAMRTAIDLKLQTLTDQEDVRLIFAVESGSRAWGFPSPDSDYDVRFVYARKPDWYLTIEPGRDVIELPLENDLDINGWDIRKALGLLIKPNPVLLEWLSSPIRYYWDEKHCQALIAFSEQVAHGSACLHHYLNLGTRQWNVYVQDKDEVNLKKYFYIVRPAMALCWIRHYPDVIPPMNFQDLVRGLELPDTLVAALQELLVRKSRSKELGLAPRIAEIDNFVLAEFEKARAASTDLRPKRPGLKAQADDLFRRILREIWA